MTPSQKIGPIITGSGTPWADHLDLGIRRVYPAGSVLLQSGQKADHLYYIQRGEVLVSIFSGPETISNLFIMRDNSVLGLIGFFTSARTSASWRALQPCTMYLFDRTAVAEKLPRHLLLNLLEQLAAMSSAMTSRFTQGAHKHETRLARLLLHLADACGDKTPIGRSGVSLVPRVTQEMVSDLLGMHPVTLNKLLAAFRSEGVIGKFTKNHLEILDTAALRRHAGEPGEAAQYELPSESSAARPM